MRLIVLVALLIGIGGPLLQAQRVILIEQRNNPNTIKLYEGDYIQYRLVDEEEKRWFGDHIYELREDIQALVFQDRFVPLADIRMIRQGRPWARNIGYMLATFGLSWSGYAAIGTATDGNPETKYEWSDAIVTGVATGTGLLLPALFGTRRVKVGEGQRFQLRIVDITF